MTNREWMELIAKEFKVSNTVAKKMLSAMYTARRICKLDESFDKERKNEQTKIQTNEPNM